MPPGGSCNLGSINLSEFVDADGNLDFDSLSDAVFTATVALNQVLDEGMPLHPLKEQRESVHNWRQIGLGVMGVADMLIKMGVAYGSDESIEICESVAHCILNSAVYSSCNLAATSGPFPRYNYNSLTESLFYDQNISDQNKIWIAKHGLRNSQLLTIAPTGTLSTMLGISGGVEPIFANSYTRKTESLYGEDKYFKVYVPIVKSYMEAHGLKDESELPDYFVTAPDIKPINRIRMQAAWQQYIDASISSTINLPNSATVEDVEEIYMNAWKHGLKGVTVFRDGCRRAAILTKTPSTDQNGQSAEPNPADVNPPGRSPARIPKFLARLAAVLFKRHHLRFGRLMEIVVTGIQNCGRDPFYMEDEEMIATISPIPRGFIIDTSDDLVGKKRKLQTGCGSLHCTAFFDPATGELMETYLSKGSQGGCNNFMIGLSRMISLAARAGVPIDAIIDQLNSSGVCPSYAVRAATKHDTSKGSCCPVAIGRALKDMWQEMQDELNADAVAEKIDEKKGYPEHSHVTSKATAQDTCPECGEPIVHEGGCDICKSCGWSKCA